MTAVTVHHLEHSRSHRILWLLEELGQTYELRTYARTRRFRAPPELAAIHPLGRSPVVEVDGMILAESGAIVEELLDRLDGGESLRPELGSVAHRRYRFFLHYAEGSLMCPLLVKLISAGVRNAPVPFFIRPVVRRIADQIDANYTNDELERHLGFLNEEVRDRSFVAGDALSAADVQLSYPLEAAVNRGALDERYPHLQAYHARLRERPAYARALERGGPVMPE